MTQTIAEQLPRLRASIDESVPAEVAEIFLREQRALASVTPEAIIEPGARLPDAELLDPHGQSTTLTEALAGRAGVLVFYRGAWCPYCNLALRTYQVALLDELERTRRAARCRQPAASRWLAHDAGEARPGLPGAIGPGQHLGPGGGDHDPAGR